MLSNYFGYVPQRWKELLSQSCSPIKVATTTVTSLAPVHCCVPTLLSAPGIVQKVSFPDYQQTDDEEIERQRQSMGFVLGGQLCLAGVRLATGQYSSALMSFAVFTIGNRSRCGLGRMELLGTMAANNALVLYDGYRLLKLLDSSSTVPLQVLYSAIRFHSCGEVSVDFLQVLETSASMLLSARGAELAWEQKVPDTMGQVGKLLAAIMDQCGQIGNSPWVAAQQLVTVLPALGNQAGDRARLGPAPPEDSDDFSSDESFSEDCPKAFLCSGVSKNATPSKRGPVCNCAEQRPGAGQRSTDFCANCWQPCRSPEEPGSASSSTE